MNKNQLLSDAETILYSFRRVELQLSQGELIDISSLVNEVHTFQNNIIELLSKNPDAEVRTQVNKVLNEMSLMYTRISDEYNTIKLQMENKNKTFKASQAYNTTTLRK